MAKAMSFSEKSPVSMLKELCDREKGVLMHEFLPYELNAITFICVVSAFDVFAKGEGRTKKLAKHKACENLLSQLLKMNRFVENFPTITSMAQMSAKGGDMSGIAVQRSMPAKSEVQRAGDSTSSTKETKQIADIVTPNNSPKNLQNEIQPPSAPKNLFSKYHELRTSKMQATPLTLGNRHNFFLRLPEEYQIRAREILLDQNGIFGTTNKDKVHLTCRALKLQYNFRSMGKSPSNYQIFSLDGDYDCVLMGKIPELYDRIVDYFKTMLNIQAF